MRKRENKKKKKKKGKIHTREWCFRHRWNFYWDRNKRRNFLRNHDIFVFTEKFKGKKNIFDKINFLFLNCNQSLEMSQVHDQKKCRSRKKENFFFHHSRSSHGQTILDNATSFSMLVFETKFVCLWIGGVTIERIFKITIHSRILSFFFNCIITKLK